MEYEIVRRLARGGMGVVDLARRDDGTLVALKRMAVHGTPVEMRQARVRFDRELEVLARLDHEAVVPMLDVVDEAGDLVLVMPYLSGGNLAERVDADGPLAPDAVRALAARLLPALAAAHRLGIVHRDIKPANVLFDDEGRAHLADFGVARTREITGGPTRPGVVLGTPGYLAPEQARGEDVGPAADVASLGATLHFAATGRSPYGTGEDHAVLLRTARGRPKVDKAIEPTLRRMVAAMLRPDPDARPTAAELAGGADGTRVLLLLPRRQRIAAVLGAGAAVALAVTGAVVLLSDDDPAASNTTTTVPECQPLPYRPCGGLPAPNTDGERCIDDLADYDEIAENGCEAAPDGADGEVLLDRIAANIVPEDDADRYPLDIDDAGDIGCNNTFRLRIVAPPGTSLRVTLTDDEGTSFGDATSSDGTPGELAVEDPRCFQDDGGGFVVEVGPIGSDRSAESYILTRSGSF